MIVRLDLAYDGTGFRGWARQPRVPTIQAAVEDVLAKVLREMPKLSVAGRTDAGVHAEGQVASFEAPDDLDVVRVQRALNGVLAPSIVCLRAVRAPNGFDARRSASGRRYRYVIDTAAVPDPFRARFEWHRPGELSLTQMRAAARRLIGDHDFASFCRAPELPASTVRNLRRLSVARQGDRLIVVAEANAFLHQMVRSLVGTLVAVGAGKMEAERMPEVLAARDRAAAGPVAPPHGLTLVKVLYGRRDLR